MNVSKFLIDYYNSNQYIFPFFNYTPVLTIALLATNKIATFAWNFGDLLLILVSRALYGKFKALNRYVEGRAETQGSLPLIRKGILSWRTIRSNFLLITELLHLSNRLLSPLVWLSFTTDIFFICRQVWYNKEHKTIANFFADDLLFTPILYCQYVKNPIIALRRSGTKSITENADQQNLCGLVINSIAWSKCGGELDGNANE